MHPAFSVIFLTTLIGAGQGLFLALYTGQLYSLFKLLPAQDPVHFYAIGSLVALVLLGLLDDIRGLSSALRFIAYALVSLLSVWLMLGVSWWLPLAAFYVLWLLNLYNFVDGIDALAASQAVLPAPPRGC